MTTATVRYFDGTTIAQRAVALSTDQGATAAFVDQFEREVALIASIHIGDRCLYQSAINLGDV